MKGLLNPPPVTAALEQGIEGAGISREEALLLIEHAELRPFLQAAAAVRDRFKGRTVSYSKRGFIPLTHLCRDYCGYCTFRADPTADSKPYMTPQEVISVAEAGRRAGCKEALFSLGDQPEMIFPEARAFPRSEGFERTLQYLAAMTQLVLDEVGLLPHSNPGIMGAGDLEHLGESNASLGLILRTPVERTTTYKVRRVFQRADLNEFLPRERMAMQTENSMVRDQVGY